MPRHPLVDQFIIGLDGVLQPHAPRPQLLHRLVDIVGGQRQMLDALAMILADELLDLALVVLAFVQGDADRPVGRSEEHTSELQSLMRISYAVFCLKKKTQTNNSYPIPTTAIQQKQRPT